MNVELASNNTLTNCPECGGQLVSGHELVCESCGLVIDDTQLDYGPARTYETHSQWKKGTRVGPPITETRHDKGLTTRFDFVDRDSAGNVLSGKKQMQLGRLRREHKRARYDSKRERNQAHAFTEINRLVTAVGLSKAHEAQACRLFRSSQEKDLLYGRTIEGFAAASVYAVCRCNRLPHPLASIATKSTADTAHIRRCYNVLNRKLGLPAQPLTASDCIPRLLSQLDTSADVRRDSLTLAQQADGHPAFNSKNPYGIAAACIYLVAKRFEVGIPQTTLSDVADISTAAIRSHFDVLQDLYDG